jgi:hypothetical protein
MGMSSQCDNPLIQGGLKEFDQATGTLLNTYFTVPAGSIGGSVWSSAAATPDGKSVFITTGNSPTNAGDSYSVVLLDAATLAKLSSWMVPNPNGTDIDFAASPALLRATIGGKATQLVAACNKNGILYAWRTDNLASGPMWSIPVSEGEGSCFPAPVWDGTHLFQAGGKTQIDGVTYGGAVREIDPATGIPIWQTGLAQAVLGTPTLNGANVMAVCTWNQRVPTNIGSLVDTSTGGVLGTFSTAGSSCFAQPVFAGQYLFVATVAHGMFAYTPAALAGQNGT